MATEQEIDEIATRLGEGLIAKILSGQGVDVISELLESGSPVWYQTDAEGISPLHAASYVQNADLIRLLLEKGAVWNAVDNLKNTAGDIALSFNNETIYTLIRDAGIRSELLLGLLASRKSEPSSLILSSAQSNAMESADEFLKSELRYIKDEQGQDVCLLDVEGEEVGVMMGWERGIMQETVRKLVGGHPHADGLQILNVGFGLGIFDSLCQSLPTPPENHVIIEAHPDVLSYMKKEGWFNKPGVTILEGKWQDLIDSPQLQSFGGFDIIYTDTFSEDYGQLRQFFNHLPTLLADGDACFSFFHGLGATNALFYDVYTRISDMHLSRCGVNVEWSDMDVIQDAQENRWGRSREYFSLPIYRLPVGKLKEVIDA